MDEMRAMLDELMGSDRNLSHQEKEKVKPKKRRFTDRDVCKYHLCGFCPYEEFRRTKNDIGDCPCVHDDDCKGQWEALEDSEKERYGYEYDLMRRIERFLSDLRKRMDSNKRRLQLSQKPVFLAEDQAMLDSLNKQIDELLAKAAQLGEEGDVDAAEAATKAADEIKERKVAVERQADARSGNGATRGLMQSVCPISGLIINDEETRLRDHHAEGRPGGAEMIGEEGIEVEEGGAAGLGAEQGLGAAAGAAEGGGEAVLEADLGAGLGVGVEIDIEIEDLGEIVAEIESIAVAVGSVAKRGKRERRGSARPKKGRCKIRGLVDMLVM